MRCVALFPLGNMQHFQEGFNRLSQTLFWTRVSPDEDPAGPSSGFQRVFRGGAFHENRMGIRGKSRHFAMPQASNDYLGFRCAMTPED